MDKLTLQVENRTAVGRGAAGRMRKAGRIPAVIYGNKGTRNLSVSEAEFRMLMRAAHGSANPIVEITDDKGEKSLSIVQEFQRDFVTDRVQHIDFHEVSADQIVHAEVPVHTTGTAQGVRDGGTLDIVLHTIPVECSPLNMPNEITVDVSGLNIGDSLHVGDLPKLEGVTYNTDAEQPVVSVSAPMAEEELEPEGEASAEVPTVAETESEEEASEEEKSE